MARLQAEFEALGLADVQTFIANGNVVFGTRARDMGLLAARIEAHLHSAFGFEIHTFLRTPAEVASIARCAPFDAATAAACKTFVVGFVAKPLGRDALERIARFESDADHFHAQGRELYWLSRQSQHESRFSNVAFEKALGVRTTFRAMTTVHALARAHAGAPAGG